MISTTFPNQPRLTLQASSHKHEANAVSPRNEESDVHGLSEAIVGVLGGGQLGRMLCQAASQMAI